MVEKLHNSECEVLVEPESDVSEEGKLKSSHKSNSEIEKENKGTKGEIRKPDE